MRKDDTFLLYEKEVAEFKLELIRRLNGKHEPGDTRKPKRTSKISMVEKVLTLMGRPLHMSEIIAAVKTEYGVQLNPDSVSSALSKQVRQGKRFIKVAPNTFGLRPR